LQVRPRRPGIDVLAVHGAGDRDAVVTVVHDEKSKKNCRLTPCSGQNNLLL
jgi:hypothetical protein